MDTDKLQELLEEYLADIDNGDDIEVISTPRNLARIEIEQFLEWLSEKPYYIFENV